MGLKPIYSIVARELALGISLPDICSARGLPLESVQRVVRGDLFKAELGRCQERIEQEMVEHAATDPVLLKLKALSGKAVDALGDEVDNFDPKCGASSASRISASKAILDRAGYAQKREDEKAAQVIILSLSEAKLNAVKRVDVNQELLDSVPDVVDGHLQAKALACG